MRDARHELAERREPLRADQVLLGLPQSGERVVGPLRGVAPVRLATADLLQERVRRPGDVAEFVAPREQVAVAADILWRGRGGGRDDAVLQGVQRPG
ncbi:hypothetical protein [Methylobacterium radiotolerans]|uniref:hypothetical protein n=1 Tax=Methylobacterium radiotolerans TaxID=31998 RepID=UPI00339840CA